MEHCVWRPNKKKIEKTCQLIYPKKRAGKIEKNFILNKKHTLKIFFGIIESYLSLARGVIKMKYASFAILFTLILSKLVYAEEGCHMTKIINGSQQKLMVHAVYSLELKKKQTQDTVIPDTQYVTIIGPEAISWYTGKPYKFCFIKVDLSIYNYNGEQVFSGTVNNTDSIIIQATGVFKGNRLEKFKPINKK